MTHRATTLALGALLSLGMALSGCRQVSTAARDVDQHQPADPNGTVEILNTAGSVEISGWDRPEVWVTGHIAGRVERVELSTSGTHTLVRVIRAPLGFWIGDSSARLSIRVPSRSALKGSSASADWSISGVSGAEEIHAVSGTIKSDGTGSARINTVSGEIQLSVVPGSSAEIHSVSGDVTLTGAGGDVSVTTVSGDGHLMLDTLQRFRLHTVSGDFSIGTRLEPTAQFEASSISGTLHADFSGTPAAQFDLHSVSGNISNCTDPKSIGPNRGPGSRLIFATGDGKAQVRLSSTSGDLSVCSK
jgi:hypothetical protein